MFRLEVPSIVDRLGLPLLMPESMDLRSTPTMPVFSPIELLTVVTKLLLQ